VQISRSARLRRCSVIFGGVRFNSNAPTNSRHALGATVSRSIVRDKRGPREVARIRERHGRARDEDGETRDRDTATGLKTINDENTPRTERWIRWIIRHRRRRRRRRWQLREDATTSISPLDRERREIDPRARGRQLSKVWSRDRTGTRYGIRRRIRHGGNGKLFSDLYVSTSVIFPPSLASCVNRSSAIACCDIF